MQTELDENIKYDVRVAIGREIDLLTESMKKHLHQGFEYIQLRKRRERLRVLHTKLTLSRGPITLVYSE